MRREKNLMRNDNDFRLHFQFSDDSFPSSLEATPLTV